MRNIEIVFLVAEKLNVSINMQFTYTVCVNFQLTSVQVIKDSEIRKVFSRRMHCHSLNIIYNR
jgi:hypothetical protein